MGRSDSEERRLLYRRGGAPFGTLQAQGERQVAAEKIEQHGQFHQEGGGDLRVSLQVKSNMLRALGGFFIRKGQRYEKSLVITHDDLLHDGCQCSRHHGASRSPEGR